MEPHLDCPNIIYNVAKYKKPRYKKLNIFVSSINNLNTLTKTMIFVNSVNKKMFFTKYLRKKLLDNLKNKTKDVI